MRSVNDSPHDRRRGRGRPRRASGSGVPPRRGPAAPYEALAERRRRRHRRRRVHAKRRIAIGLVLVIILVVAAAAGGSLFVGNRYLAAGCTLKSLRPISLGQNSFLFAKDGSLLGAVPSKRNRQPLKLGQISPWLAKGTVAIEDRRFYQHGGLDYQGIARAAWSDLQAGRIVEGGSTITQELVRNLYIGNSQRTLSRKLKEACLANKLADVWTKNQILAAYLNEVFYGQRAYGAAAAAQTFFSRPANRLTLPQAALLAGLPQSPTTYDPFRNPRAARQRRNDVLRAMLQANVHHPAPVPAREPGGLQLKPGSLYSTIRHPNFFGWAETQLIARFGSKAVEAGGLKVRTTIDPAVAVPGPAGDADGAARETDPARCARVDRPVDGRGPRDGQLPAERAEAQVQHRDPGRPPGGIVVQAVHARDGAERGHLAPVDLQRPARR